MAMTTTTAVRFVSMALVATAAAALWGCGGEKEPVVLDDAGPASYVDAEADFTPIVFADGHRTLNDRCMVRQAKLNLRMPPLYVNGEPVGFC